VKDLIKKSLNQFIKKSPQENFRMLKSRLLRQGFDYPAESVIENAKHMDPAKLIDRLHRYERVLKNKIGWEPLNFFEKSVLEIGAGPLLGWGPIAIYLGAKSYVCLDPGFNKFILLNQIIWDKYFYPLFLHLESIYSRKVSFYDFKSSILSRIIPSSLPFEKIDSMTGAIDGFDIVMSNSVMEHVWDWDVFAPTLLKQTASQTRHLHAIDFSCHKNESNPFGNIYDFAPLIYIEKYGRLINLKKLSELHDHFKSNGLEFMMVPYLIRSEDVFENIDPYWNKFLKNELQTQVGFLVK
jgi:hypothetical protein